VGSETSAQVSTKVKRDRSSKSKYLNPAKVDCWRGHPDFKSPDHAKSTQQQTNFNHNLSLDTHFLAQQIPQLSLPTDCDQATPIVSTMSIFNPASFQPLSSYH
jgi:hypothetical protein